VPLDPTSPGFLAAIDGFIADVETLMREKLKGIGDYKNLADIESEIDKLTLRIEILGPDPEFQEVAKRMDLKRQDVSRKRDQMKPFLLKLERELALYQSAKSAASGMQAVAPAPVFAAPAPAPAPAPVFTAPAPVFAAPVAPPPQPPAAAAPPSFAPQAARPLQPPPAPGARAPQPPPLAPAWPEPAPVAAAPPAPIDMSLPPDDGDVASFISPSTDFITGPGTAGGGGDLAEAELMLESEVAPPAPVAPVNAAAQWPPPGEAILDPFAAFQPAKPAPAAPPRPPVPTPPPAAAPRAPAPPQGPPRPAGPPTPTAAPVGTRPPGPPPPTAPAGSSKTPPWQK